MGNKKKHGWLWLFIIIAVIIVLFFTLTGFVVIQPIGALPEGATLWYFRPGTGFSFLTSPDGFLLDRVGEVSLLGRSMALTQIMKSIDGKRIGKLPYMEFLYLRSTGGVTFAK